MPKEIKCNVDSCNYNQQKKCTAEEIEVNKQVQEPNCSADTTFCETFKTDQC